MLVKGSINIAISERVLNPLGFYISIVKISIHFDSGMISTANMLYLDHCT